MSPFLRAENASKTICEEVWKLLWIRKANTVASACRIAPKMDRCEVSHCRMPDSAERVRTPAVDHAAASFEETQNSRSPLGL